MSNALRELLGLLAGGWELVAGEERKFGHLLRGRSRAYRLRSPYGREREVTGGAARQAVLKGWAAADPGGPADVFRLTDAGRAALAALAAEPY